MSFTRRGLLAGLFATPVLAASPGLARVPELPPTPACGDDPDRTPRQTEGPFYTPDTPRRHDIAAEVEGGDRLLIGGFVVTPACAPLAGAVVDVWHADHQGRYDNSGFRLRGHVETDAAGRWWFSTVEPARYSGRTRHIHVKVRPAGGKVLTTQLYFPGDPGNDRDFLFDARLLMRMAEEGEARFGRFDFVVA